MQYLILRESAYIQSIADASYNQQTGFSLELACLFLSADFFSKSTFLKNSYMITLRVPNSVDPDQAQHFLGTHMGPNCLQRLSADDKAATSKKRVQEK